MLLRDAPDAELIPRLDRLPALPVDLDHLLAVYLAPGFVGERRQDLLGSHVNHLAGRRIAVLGVQAECDPARLLAQADAHGLLRRHDGIVEDVYLLVERVHDPDLLLVRRQADAVAGAAVSLHRPLLRPLNFHSMELLAGRQVADLKAETLVDVHIDERLSSVHCEGADGIGDRPGRADDCVLFCVRDSYWWR